MSSASFFFWFSLSLLFFCYLGFGMLIFLLNGIRNFLLSANKTIVFKKEKLPVTLIVTACDEEQILEQKIENTLALNYPVDKLKIIFITDGSSDGSLQLISQYPSITLLHQQERKGKIAAIKRAMHEVNTPVVIFSDANAMLNKDSIEHITSHYYNPKIGGVAGEKKIFLSHHISAVGEAEGMYWQYESLMKKLDADFNTVVGAAGELFSIRTDLFQEFDDALILDDFVISMQVCLQGHKMAYEPRAFATELPSVSLYEEEKRKVRIAAGAYQSIRYLKSCLNVFKYPLLSFQFFSRRLLRWIFCPVMLPILFFTNIYIVNRYPQSGFYLWFMYMQFSFYFLALAGWLLVNAGRRSGWFAIPFYFVFMNYCLLKGFINFLKGRQTVLWKKSLRQAME